MIRFIAICLLAGCLAGCAHAPQAAAVLPPFGIQGGQTPGMPQHWVAVLVAGDGSLPVFDNAVDRMDALLRRSGTPESDIHRLSAARSVLAQPGVQVATRAHVLDAVANLHPAYGQACFVFITSHGAHGPGVYLSPWTEFVPPDQLDVALQAGCGDAPTVAVVSACYTGDFAQAPMARANRIVLTAARADRPSFGCGAGRELAWYDQCLLGTLAARPATWPDVIADTDACITRLETKAGEPASDPQSAVGQSVARLAVVGG